MGFLDSAGLARFTAWVKERLAGKLDRTGGVLEEQEEFMLSSSSSTNVDECSFYLGGSMVGIAHSAPDIYGGIDLTDASVRLYGYGEASVGSELVVSDLEIFAGTTGENGVMETHLTPRDLTISANGEGGASTLTFDGTDGLKVTKCAEPEEDSMPATKGYVDDKFGGAVKTASGSYTGNGDYAAPTAVEIGFRPKFFVCTRKDLMFASAPTGTNTYGPIEHLVWLDGMGRYTIANGMGAGKDVPVAATETGISYGLALADGSSRASMENLASLQLNSGNAEYVWFAMG